MVVHNCAWLVFVPKTGHGFAKQNPNGQPQRRAALSSQTAAVARNGLTAPAARPLYFSCLRLVVGIAFGDLNGLQLHHPGAVFELVARVNCGIIRRLVADHRGDDFEPAHSQAA